MRFEQSGLTSLFGILCWGEGVVVDYTSRFKSGEHG